MYKAPSVVIPFLKAIELATPLFLIVTVSVFLIHGYPKKINFANKKFRMF